MPRRPESSPHPVLQQYEGTHDVMKALDTSPPIFLALKHSAVQHGTHSTGPLAGNEQRPKLSAPYAQHERTENGNGDAQNRNQWYGASAPTHGYGAVCYRPMARGSDMRARLLWQRFTSHLWKVIRITGQPEELTLHLDGSGSIDAKRGRHHESLDMAMSTLRLYLNEYGPNHFEGQAKEFLLNNGLAIKGQFDRLD